MVCASHGFKVHYLGTDLPPLEIARFARESGAAGVALSVVLQERLADLPSQLSELASGLPQSAYVWLGGSGTRSLQRGQLPPNCVVQQDSAELEQRLEMLAA
jgi:methylmalonyl-CoA mutase cobalamin-binding subunit